MSAAIAPRRSSPFVRSNLPSLGAARAQVPLFCAIVHCSPLANGSHLRSPLVGGANNCITLRRSLHRLSPTGTNCYFIALFRPSGALARRDRQAPVRARTLFFCVLRLARSPFARPLSEQSRRLAKRTVVAAIGEGRAVLHNDNDIPSSKRGKCTGAQPNSCARLRERCPPTEHWPTNTAATVGRPIGLSPFGAQSAFGLRIILILKGAPLRYAPTFAPYPGTRINEGACRAASSIV